MANYQPLRDFIDARGGFTETARIMATSPQTLFNALSANRTILVKLDDDENFIQAYEIKSFPTQKLEKV